MQSRRSARTPARRLVERAVGEQAALADDDDALGQRLDVVHVVGREQHGHALLAVEPPHELAHGELRRRIEADRRLVEEQDRGIVQQGRGELRAHALAERELAHRLVEQRLEPQHGHELVASAAIALGLDAIDVGAADRSRRCTGRSHHSWLRWPNTTPMRATWRTRSS